jgi:hypothetical protein
MAQQTLKIPPTVTHDGVEMGSERNFGLVFAALFLVISLWPLAHGNDPRFWALSAGTGFLTLALALPEVLRPLNIAWFRLGLLIGRVMTPIVMAAIFLLTVVPVGLAMRAAGKDVLRLSRRPDLKSYWITRDNPGPERGSMKRQF